MSDKRFTDVETAETVARARTLTDMRADERRAADLLKELLVGEHAPRDTDGAQGMHDFDLRLDDGRTLGAEATTDTSRVDRAFPDQINRASPLDVPGLARMQHVGLATPDDSPDDQQATRARPPPRPESASVPWRCSSQRCHGAEHDRECGERELAEQSRQTRQRQDRPSRRGPPVPLVELRAAAQASQTEATSSPSHTGPDGFKPIDLQAIDTVRVAAHAGPSHAPNWR